MRDPYEVLGLDRSADEAAIKAAYRKLAKRHHPDLHPGDKKAAERFQELNNANDLLSDPEKRGRFDRGAPVQCPPPRRHLSRRRWRPELRPHIGLSGRRERHLPARSVAGRARTR